MHNKIFISYAKEDLAHAEQLFDFLQSNRFEPWLDKRKLLPGQRWDTEIQLALKKADFIVLLLSSVSVAKRGYVQREFRLALDYCNEKLESDIYLIPCKIDECTVPEKLAKFQWLDFKTNSDFQPLLNSIEAQRRNHIDEQKVRSGANQSPAYEEVQIRRTIHSEIDFEIDISYPKFFPSNVEEIEILNVFVQQVVFKTYSSFVSHPYFDWLLSNKEEGSAQNSGPPHHLDISHKVEFVTPRIVSILLFEYTFSGGAHGNYWTHCHNYLLSPIHEISIERLFDWNEEVLPILVQLCKRKLLDKAMAHGISSEDEFFLNPLEGKWNHFSSYYFSKHAIVIVFQVYQLTSYAAGQHEVEILFSEILSRKSGLQTFERIVKMITTQNP